MNLINLIMDGLLQMGLSGTLGTLYVCIHLHNIV